MNFSHLWETFHRNKFLTNTSKTILLVCHSFSSYPLFSNIIFKIPPIYRPSVKGKGEGYGLKKR
jgi:hypothetical protein